MNLAATLPEGTASNRRNSQQSPTEKQFKTSVNSFVARNQQ
jgi:hypothetical protein